MVAEAVTWPHVLAEGGYLGDIVRSQAWTGG